MTTPRHVMHDGLRWTVDSEYEVGPELWLVLRRPGPCPRLLHARETDCEVILEKPRKRRLKSGRFVLEFCEGTLCVRKQRSSKRFYFTLAETYDMAVKRATFGGDTPKALRPRARR